MGMADRERAIWAETERWGGHHAGASLGNVTGWRQAGKSGDRCRGPAEKQ